MTALQVSTLDERYRREDGTIFLTGIQALVRMLLDRARHDERAGLRTVAYVSGYEGSPLAGYDLELARQAALLREHRVTHQPG
jgi:indolepyruvate ferredoxin oxidoreductase